MLGFQPSVASRAGQTALAPTAQLEDAYVTTLERLREQGRRQDREEGAVHEARKLATRILTVRFGPVPADAVHRIEEAVLGEPTGS